MHLRASPTPPPPPLPSPTPRVVTKLIQSLTDSITSHLQAFKIWIEVFKLPFWPSSKECCKASHRLFGRASTGKLTISAPFPTPLIKAWPLRSSSDGVNPCKRTTCSGCIQASCSTFIEHICLIHWSQQCRKRCSRAGSDFWTANLTPACNR